MSLLDRAVSLTIPLVPKPLVRYFSRRYIAGTSEDDAIRVVRDLANQGAMSTVDILGEFITTADDARVNTTAYEHLIQRIAEERFPDAIEWPSLGLPDDYKALLAPNRKAFIRKEETKVSHGGISIEELVVPLIEIERKEI